MKKNLSTSKPGLFKIALYVRVSTEEQAENPEGSIRNQELRLREYINLKNQLEPFGQIVALYSDPGVSAKNMKRPGFQKMLSAIKNKEVSLVLVTELSRFSRSTKDFALLQEFLEQNNCKFMSLRENFDTSGAAGSMVLNLIASIAEFERRQTAERISQSYLARAKRGLYNGGSLPLGYESDPDRPGSLRIVESEAELVRLIFKVFLKEKTLAAAAKFLNQNEVQLPMKMRNCGSHRNKRIGFDTVYRILKNKAYIAVKVYSTKSGLAEAKAVWEAIIDEALFYKVQETLTANCSKRKTHPNKYPFTLSGLIKCGHCGETMSGASATGGTGKRVGYYEHAATRKLEAGLHYKLIDHKPRRIPTRIVDELVWSEVKKFIFDRGFCEGLMKQAVKTYQPRVGSSEQDRLVKKRNQTEKQIQVFAERIADLPEGINPSPLYQKLSELQASLKKLTAAVENEKEKNLKSDSPVELANLEVFKEKMKNYIAAAELDHQLKSAIMKIIVHKIEIKPNGLEIFFNVGENHYQETLGKSPSTSFFILADLINKKPSVNRPTEGNEYALNAFNAFYASQNLKLFSSSCLTDGGGGGNRTLVRK